MLQTCKSCGTVFEIDEGLISTNVKWLKCSVCNQKWNVSKEGKKDFDNDIIETKNHKSNDQSLKVKQDLASIKSVVEKKTKTMSLQKSSALEQKNKTVVEIASELSASKLKSNDKLDAKPNKKSRFRKGYFLYFVISLITLTAMVIFFRPLILAYTYFYFPKYADFYLSLIHI